MAGITSFFGGARLKDARAGVETAQSDVRHGYVTLDERWAALQGDVVVLKGRFLQDDGYVMQLEGYRGRAADAMQLATSAYVRIEADVDPDLDSVPAAGAVTEAWRRVGTIISDADQRLDDLRAVVVAAEHAEERCAEVLSEIEGRIAAAEQAIGDAAAIGFAVDELRSAVAACRDDVARGGAALQERRLWDATTTLRRADEAIDRALEDARRLGLRRAELLRRADELAVQARAADDGVTRTAHGVDALGERYCRTVWDAVADAPRTAAGLVCTIHDRVGDVRDALSMDVQNFARARELIGLIVADLASVHQLEARVRTLHHDVARAIADYPRLHAEAVRSLSDATMFVRQFAHQVNPAHQAALERASAILHEAESMAASATADPFLASSRLREVDSATDAVLYAARDDRQRLAAHASHTSNLLQDATWAANRADAASGLGLFGWSRSAKDRMVAVRQQLAQASTLLRAAHPGAVGRAEALIISADHVAHQIIAESRGLGRR